MTMGTPVVEEARAKVKYRTFSYKTAMLWTSGRSGVVSSEGKPDLHVSSPPEFKGEAGHWTPEDLFVAALDICTMTTFASFAQHMQIPVVGYRSSAEGTLEFVDDGYRFTRVVLRPRIAVANADAVGPAIKAIHDAHASCLIGRSVRAEVTIEPRIEVAAPENL
jgi:organic hydroperoxide reductase OsmC/OhrA